VQALRDETYRAFADLMYESVGLSFGEGKKSLISTRLGPRIQRLGLAGYDEYLATITGADDGGEFQMAVDLLTTNETYFFREPEHFDLLEREILANRPPDYAVWSAACSFGDEPYTVAMLLADLQRRGAVGQGWSVLGTDISDRVLRSAVSGIVPQDRLRHVSPDRLRRYCLRGEGDSEGKSMIQPELRERVRFGQLNLCRPIEDLGPFDAVFLRNVLIYFDAQTKAEVVDRVLTQLRPGGLFFIGTAEGRVACRTPLQSLRPGVFRKGAP
jgi:chemotaxis protein methyltransferase CheR